MAPKALGTLTKPEDVTLPPYYPRDPVLLEDWAQYLDCIRFTDQQVGEILQRLETEGILDQTFIILMGDNGISHARGKLSPLQEELLFSPTRPPEELYDVMADPFETRNLAADPHHRVTLETMRARVERWMLETRDPGPESEKAYDANLDYELNIPAGKARKDALIKNSALMKQWAREGK